LKQRVGDVEAEGRGVEGMGREGELRVRGWERRGRE